MTRVMGDDSWKYIMMDKESWKKEHQKGKYGTMARKTKKAEDAKRRQRKSRALKGIREAFDELLDVLEKSQIDNMEIASIFTPDKIERFVEAIMTRDRLIEDKDGRKINPINTMMYSTGLARAMKKGLDKNWEALSWDIPIISRPKEGTSIIFERKGRKIHGYSLVTDGKVIGQASFEDPLESG